VFRDLLDKFVDRKPELGLFRQMLGGETRQRLLLILDGPEKGKTWFIWRLFQECQDGGVPVVHLDFDQRRSGLAGDWLSVADEVCTALGDQRTPIPAIARRGWPACRRCKTCSPAAQPPA